MYVTIRGHSEGTNKFDNCYHSHSSNFSRNLFLLNICTGEDESREPRSGCHCCFQACLHWIGKLFVLHQCHSLHDFHISYLWSLNCPPLFTLAWCNLSLNFDFFFFPGPTTRNRDRETRDAFLRLHSTLSKLFLITARISLERSPWIPLCWRFQKN